MQRIEKKANLNKRTNTNHKYIQMEKMSQNRTEQSRREDSATDQKRSLKVFKTDEFTSCKSPFCHYISETKRNKWGLKLALCCTTLLSTRALKYSDHPKEAIKDLFRSICHSGCSEHEAFHQFIEKEAQKLTIEQPHNQKQKVILFLVFLNKW